MSHQPLTPQMLLQAACNRLGFVYAGARGPHHVAPTAARARMPCARRIRQGKRAHPVGNQRMGARHSAAGVWGGAGGTPLTRTPRAVAAYAHWTAPRAEIWRPRTSNNGARLARHPAGWPRCWMGLLHACCSVLTHAPASRHVRSPALRAGTMLCLFATSANEEDADDPMRAFASESRRISLSSGSGLPGRVWATRQVRRVHAPARAAHRAPALGTSPRRGSRAARRAACPLARRACPAARTRAARGRPAIPALRSPEHPRCDPRAHPRACRSRSGPSTFARRHPTASCEFRSVRGFARARAPLSMRAPAAARARTEG